MGTKRYREDEYILNWFEQNLDIDARTIYMGSLASYEDGGESGVDNLMAEYFVKGMHLLESKNSEKPITIIMNNPGGDWYHGMAIYDSISCSLCPCTIKVYGHAMSMGSVILQAADYRILMPRSRMMIHYGYDGRYGHSKIFEKWSDEGKRTNYDMENIYLDSMLAKEEAMGSGHLAKILAEIVNKQKSLEIPKPEIVSYSFSKNQKTKREEIRGVLKELLNFDTILTPIETVNLGLADEIFTIT